MKSLFVTNQDLTPRTSLNYVSEKRVSGSSQVGRVVAVLLILLLFDSVSMASTATYYDADKPINPATGKLYAGDLSCWLATGANMMAADGWGDAQTIYDYYYGNFYCPMYWGCAATPADALALAQCDPIPGIEMDETTWIYFGSGGNANSLMGTFATKPLLNAQAEIDYLLNTYDDPVGIRLYNASGLAHYITAWKDLNGTLTVTDSDDSVSGPMYYQWNNSWSINYAGGANINVVTMLGDGTQPDPVPEPGSLSLMGMGLAAVAWRRRMLLRKKR
jgi:hypothetical protein